MFTERLAEWTYRWMNGWMSEWVSSVVTIVTQGQFLTNSSRPMNLPKLRCQHIYPSAPQKCRSAEQQAETPTSKHAIQLRGGSWPDSKLKTFKSTSFFFFFFCRIKQNWKVFRRKVMFAPEHSAVIVALSQADIVRWKGKNPIENWLPAPEANTM